MDDHPVPSSLADQLNGLSIRQPDSPMADQPNPASSSRPVIDHYYKGDRLVINHKLADGSILPLIHLAHAEGERCVIDPNPPVFRSRQAREGWTMKDYTDYIAGSPKFREESLDEEVIISRMLFYQDYFALCARKDKTL